MGKAIPVVYTCVCVCVNIDTLLFMDWKQMVSDLHLMSQMKSHVFGRFCSYSEYKLGLYGPLSEYMKLLGFFNSLIIMVN